MGGWNCSKCSTSIYTWKSAFASPKTGYPSDETGKIVAENIIRVTKGETKLKEKFGKNPRIMYHGCRKKRSYYLLDKLLNLEILPLCFQM